MTRSLLSALLFGLAIASAACAGIKNSDSADGHSLGIIPIGGAPQNMGSFVSSNCARQPKFSDCAAQDSQGRKYAFFGGALSKVSVTRDDAAEALRLPAGLRFGETIESAAQKLTSAFGVELDRSLMDNGQVVYSSDFTIRSSVNIYYSIELVADKNGLLTEVIERTDF